LLTVKKSINGEGLDCDTMNSIIQGVTIETKNLDAAPDELQELYPDEESPRLEGLEEGISSLNLNLKKVKES
jgi:hypothetical protein